METTTVQVVSLEQLKRTSIRNDQIIARIKREIGQAVQLEDEPTSLMDMLTED